MLVEQLTEFESRVPGSLIEHILLKLDIFWSCLMSESFNAKNVAQGNVPC